MTEPNSSAPTVTAADEAPAAPAADASIATPDGKPPVDGGKHAADIPDPAPESVDQEPSVKPASGEDVETLQFPALAGDPEAEVDSRQADGSEGLTLFKDVVMKLDKPGQDPGEDQHAANRLALLTEAGQRGLHPDAGDPALVSLTVHTDGRSTVARYSVHVIPASIHDLAPADTTVPRYSPSMDESAS